MYCFNSTVLYTRRLCQKMCVRPNKSNEQWLLFLPALRLSIHGPTLLHGYRTRVDRRVRDSKNGRRYMPSFTSKHKWNVHPRASFRYICNALRACGHRRTRSSWDLHAAVKSVILGLGMSVRYLDERLKIGWCTRVAQFVQEKLSSHLVFYFRNVIILRFLKVQMSLDGLPNTFNEFMRSSDLRI